MAMRSGSSSKSSRGSSRTRRYRMQAPFSQVDQTLFLNPAEVNLNRNSASKTKNQGRKDHGEETVQIITKDLIRHLRIPLKDPTGDSITLPSAEFERITSMPMVLQKGEREALTETCQKKKEEEIKAVRDRKHQILEADKSRRKNKGLTELELESRKHDQHLVELSNALRMEQDHEIKKLNMLILEAQCQATRDAQIQEKKQIQAELSEEEKRLDDMMEMERQKALESQTQKDELRRHQRMSGMHQIYNQIQQRLEEKQLLEEIKEQEKQQIRENQEKMLLEDCEALEKKRREQQHLQAEVMRTNAETMRAKEQRREEEKLADMRDMEYIRNKLVRKAVITYYSTIKIFHLLLHLWTGLSLPVQEREAEYEAEHKRIQKEKELEIGRLRAQQEKQKDYKAEQDEIRARRNQEVTDREWRKKAKYLAAKKAQEEEMLRIARLDQVQCKERLLSIEAGREKAEVERVLKVQQEALIKQREEEQKQRLKAQQHAEAIRHQIKQREFSALAKRREIFVEAESLMEVARQRRVRLDEIKEKKLKELKDTGLSEKYCSEVERKAWSTRTHS